MMQSYHDMSAWKVDCSGAREQFCLYAIRDASDSDSDSDSSSDSDSDSGQG